jgi:hypothetical protein
MLPDAALAVTTWECVRRTGADVGGAGYRVPSPLPPASRAAAGLRCAPLLAGLRPPLTPPGAMEGGQPWIGCLPMAPPGPASDPGRTVAKADGEGPMAR